MITGLGTWYVHDAGRCLDNTVANYQFNEQSSEKEIQIKFFLYCTALHLVDALDEHPPLAALPPVEGHGLGVLPHAHQRVSKVGLALLLPAVGWLVG